MAQSSDWRVETARATDTILLRNSRDKPFLTGHKVGPNCVHSLRWSSLEGVARLANSHGTRKVG